VRSERNIKFKNSMRYQNSATSTCQQALTSQHAIDFYWISTRIRRYV